MRNILLFLFLLFSHFVSADNITYAKSDSIKVVALLKEGNKEFAKNKQLNLMLYYGKKLCKIPYVAHTLEVNPVEKLVVNLHQLDCTTFVETVFALCLTTRQGSISWFDYSSNLQKIRYKDGYPNGYTSRNHYFLWWIDINKEKGLVSTPLDDNMRLCESVGEPLPSYVRKQYINIDYMSTHANSYVMLKNKKNDIDKIAELERSSKGRVMYYIPSSQTGLKKQVLGKYIKDGDILAIATTKKGLDTSHIGIACWSKKGTLHLLNASQIHKKVILEPMSLRAYMKKHPSQLGIWIIRPNL